MTLDAATRVELARWWWTFVLRGVVAIGFGVLAFLAPVFGIAILVALFAAWALIDGIGSLITFIRGDAAGGSRWWELVEAIAGIGAAVLAVLFPAFAAAVLVLIIAAWAIVTGVFEIIGAIALRKQIDGELWLGLAGVASIVFGVLLFFFPAAGALTIVWLIGGYAIVFGVMLIFLGFKLRGYAAPRGEQRSETPAA